MIKATTVLQKSYKMPEDTAERPFQLRHRLSKYVNLGLCGIGIIFIIAGVLKSTLLLYIGCALVGAAVGGFIRSRLPVQNMVPSTGLQIIYRSELQRNVQSYHDGLQTFVVMHNQQPCGIGKKKINQHTSVTKYNPSLSFLNTESFDRISIISSLTERSEAGESCCIICLAQFRMGQDVRQLPCQHIFHIGCIDRWLKINRLCPTCRRDITMPNKRPTMSSFNETEASSNSLVLNNEAAVEHVEQDNADPASSSITSNDAISIEIPNDESSDSHLREDNIVEENDVSHSLVPRDVVIPVAESNGPTVS